jgi:hypothetical protein
LSCTSVRCTSLGIYYGAIGFALLFSGIAAGKIGSVLGPESTFAFGSATSFLAALALWRSTMEAKEIHLGSGAKVDLARALWDD